MLGHKLVQKLSDSFETYATVRSAPGRLDDFAKNSQLIAGVTGEDFDSIAAAYARVKPDAVINCIGIVKQLPEAHDPVKSIVINSLLPHRLATLSQASGARLIHISTDCVFSGSQGNYKETDLQDAEDLYGKSKALGEVTAEHCLTLRTSLIGRQLAASYGLVEWILSQRETAKGYTKAIFSGFPTVVLVDIIKEILLEHEHLKGLYHVASEPISKYDLLQMINRAFRLNLDVVPDTEVVCDRSLNGQRFQDATGIAIPGWTAMIDRLHEDGVWYEQRKQQGNLIQR